MDFHFPEVPPARGHYESLYFVAVHPTQPRAIWVRTTVRKRPGQGPTGAVWVTWFTGDAVLAAKVDEQPVGVAGGALTVGSVTNGVDGSTGEVAGDALHAVWDLRFTDRSGALEHLHPRVLYRAPFPRTKATSPAPRLVVGGTLRVNGASIDLAGWTGMLGHNWGSEHAARWIWLRAAGLGEDGSGWLDAVLARVQLGPVLTPWIGFGALELEGTRHPVGGMVRRGTRVVLGPAGALVTLGGRGLEVAVDAQVPLASTVGWEYADPGGATHEVVNSSVATVAVVIHRRGAGERRLVPAVRGVLEVGGATPAFAVPRQPYRDTPDP